MATIGKSAILTDQNDLTPINDIIAVTPSDSQDLQYNGQSIPCRALIFNGAGNVVLEMAGGNVITLAITSSWFGVQYLRVRRIRATGTTATGIYACY